MQAAQIEGGLGFNRLKPMLPLPEHGHEPAFAAYGSLQGSCRALAPVHSSRLGPLALQLLGLPCGCPARSLRRPGKIGLEQNMSAQRTHGFSSSLPDPTWCSDLLCGGLRKTVLSDSSDLNIGTTLCAPPLATHVSR